MALTVTQLTKGNAGVTNTPASASITPTANKLVLAVMTARTAASNSEEDVFSLSGNGLTWVRVDETRLGDGSGSNRLGIVFRAMGSSPSSGAVTFTYGGASSLDASSWVIIQVSGTIETSGTNGSGAVGSVDIGRNVATSGSGSLSFTVPGTPSGEDITVVLTHVEDGPTLSAPSGFANASYETGGSDTQTSADYDTDQVTSGNVGYTSAPSDFVWLTQGFIVKALASATAIDPYLFRTQQIGFGVR